MLLASSNFLVPNATFIVELVAFLLVLGALAKWVLPVVNRSMEERQATIRQALTDAEEAKRRSEEAEAQYKRVIDEAREEARHLVDEANRMAEQLRSEKRQQADQEYERIITRARGDIDAEVRRAAEELRSQIAGIALAVVEKVIGEGLDAQVQRGIIERAIAEIEAQSGTTGVSS